MRGLGIPGIRSETLPESLAKWQKEATHHAPHVQTLLNYQAASGTREFYIAQAANAVARASEQRASTLQISLLPAHNLPSALGQLPALKNLSVHQTECTELPQSIENLHQLKTLALRANPGLKHLPDSLATLSQLQHLAVTHSPLESLPPDIGKLSKLSKLELSGGSYESLPPGFTQLTALQTLEISHSRPTRTQRGLTALPDDLGKLGQLTHLTLEDHAHLATLPDSLSQLRQLKTLNISSCPDLTKLPALGYLKKLRTLSLKENTGISRLPSLSSLEKLESLDLRNCTSLTALPLFWGNLKKLKTLDLRGCTNLSNLPRTLNQLPLACKISVPPHLQAELDQINADRQASHSASPAAVRSSAAAAPLPRDAWKAQLAKFADETDAHLFSHWLDACTVLPGRESQLQAVVKAAVSSAPFREKLFAFAREDVDMPHDASDGMTPTHSQPRISKGVSHVHELLLKHQIETSDAGNAFHILRNATAKEKVHLRGQPIHRVIRALAGEEPLGSGRYQAGRAPSALLMAYVLRHDSQAVNFMQESVTEMNRQMDAAHHGDIGTDQLKKHCDDLGLEQAHFIHGRCYAVAHQLAQALAAESSRPARTLSGPEPQ